MAISLRKNSDGGTVGLDIDGRFLAAAQVRDGRLTSVASTELPEGVLADGEVADRAALTAALKDFVGANKLPRRVQLGVANQQIVVRVLDLPRIDDAGERDAALRFQAADAIAMPLDEAVLDHQIAGYTNGGDAGERMQVVVVAARRSMIEDYLGAAKDAGLKAEGIDLDAFALVRMLAGTTLDGDPAPLEPSADAPGDDPAGPQAARVFCHLGGVSNLAIALGSSCFFSRTLSTPYDAEGAGPRLADEIRMSIDYYMAQPAALAVGDVVISGQGARDDALVDAVAAQLGIPVATASPLGDLDASIVSGDDDPNRYTVAAGLALGAAA
ncbi:MAG TPA: pilus assembly protein PilM [Solirubrobacteraceae bacterium]|nr:pilus assembly protein PilM [Solirubrobacteraceae bacterium]